MLMETGSKANIDLKYFLEVTIFEENVNDSSSWTIQESSWAINNEPV